MKKIIPLLFFLLISILIVLTLFFKTKPIYILNMGISLNVPKNTKVTYVGNTTFDYNGIKVPSLTIDAKINNKESINIKSFPFTTEDYMNHFKSSFTGDNIKEIKYDYKRKKIKSKLIKDIFVSKAKLNDNRTVYSYLISFNNRSGSLLIETVNFELNIGKLSVLSSQTVKFTEGITKRTLESLSPTSIGEFTIEIPSDFTFKEHINNSVNYYNFYGKSDALYISISKNKFYPITSSKWSNLNGYEVLKMEDNYYIVHDINNNNFFYMQSVIKELKNVRGEINYCRVDYIDKDHNQEIFNKFVESIK